jgi:hypothetical protein
MLLLLLLLASLRRAVIRWLTVENSTDVARHHHKCAMNKYAAISIATLAGWLRQKNVS